MYTLIKTKAYKQAEKTYGSQIGRARLDKMEADLQSNPTYNPTHIILMQGTVSTYRYKIGDYRIIYEVFEEEIEILMMTMGPRGSIYR